MPRIMQFSAPITVNLGAKERAIVAYYCSRRGGSKGAVIRAMIRKFAEADRSFVPEDFLQSVDRHLAANADEETAKGLRLAARGFLAETKSSPVE